MALFGSNKSEPKSREAKSSEGDQNTTKKPNKRVDNSLHNVIIKPLITEKATYATDDGVYTFVVQKSANKPQIKQAIKDVYSVSVKKIRTAAMPKKKVHSRRGKEGRKGGGKKAFVYLKEGDSIELM